MISWSSSSVWLKIILTVEGSGRLSSYAVELWNFMSIEIKKSTFTDAAMIGEICRPSLLLAHEGSSAMSELETYVNQNLSLDVIQKELLDDRNLFFLLNVD